MINIELIYESAPSLLYASLMSLKITFFALLIGIFGGIILGILQQSKYFLIRLPVNTYVLIIRGTPMLIQITFIYYFLPIVGISFSSTMSAIIAIGINSSAYISQIIKSGIKAVSKDQIEAAYVLGFTKIQTIKYIILPQAIRFTIPSLINEMTTLIKDSSLASSIGVLELYKEARSIINQTYDVITIFLLVATIYLSITTILALLAYLIEKRVNSHA